MSVFSKQCVDYINPCLLIWRKGNAYEFMHWHKPYNHNFQRTWMNHCANGSYKAPFHCWNIWKCLQGSRNPSATLLEHGRSSSIDYILYSNRDIGVTREKERRYRPRGYVEDIVWIFRRAKAGLDGPSEIEAFSAVFWFGLLDIHSFLRRRRRRRILIREVKIEEEEEEEEEEEFLLGK